MTLVAAALGGLLAIYRDANVDWGLFALAARGHRARPHGEQHHERPLRPRGRHRHGRLPAQPLLAASGDLRRRHPRPAGRLRARRQPRVPGDHAVPDRRARLADRRVRTGRLLPLRRVHRAADPAEEARPRRADGRRGLGSADGRWRLLRGHRVDPRRAWSSPACRTRSSAPRCSWASTSTRRRGTVRPARTRCRSSSASRSPARSPGGCSSSSTPWSSVSRSPRSCRSRRSWCSPRCPSWCGSGRSTGSPSPQ